MAHKIFLSFHYRPDYWRAAQVRNLGVVEGNQPCSDIEWENITKGGDASIRKWIAEQMDGASCVVVLIGAETAGRKWIDHEIMTGWSQGKGVFGIHVHNLQDTAMQRSKKGASPFETIPYGGDGRMLSTVVKVYDPPYSTSTLVYHYIRVFLPDWIEEAISIRNSS